MTVVLDAGAFIALERGDRAVAAALKAAWLAGRPPVTHGGIVGQVWRGESRQARLAAVLRGVEVVALDAALGRQAGALLASVGTTDVIDAALVCLARDGDDIHTSDPGDIAALAAAADLHVDVVPR